MNTLPPQNTLPDVDKPPPVYQSNTLFQGGKVILIMHEGREYQLRITHAGKLILTA
jgi:hemin uptake protein HemP